MSAQVPLSEASPADLVEPYREVRARSQALAAPLGPEDCALQSMPDASPVKWHLAHTTWFFETFVLERARPAHQPFHPRFRFLFNSYYNSVGRQYARPRRGMLSRPDLDEVLRYRRFVDEHMLAVLERGEDDKLAHVVRVGLHHEQQHQELILTDLKHAFGENPLRPAYRDDLAEGPAGEAPPVRWHRFGDGTFEIGHRGRGFAFDNEGPRHERLLRPFELASRTVTAGEYLAFMEDGGYQRPDLWLSDAWAWLQETGIRAPLYWEEQGGAWHQLTLGGDAPVRADEPVVHVSYYEADAYASWTGFRLPDEAEWEVASRGASVRGNFVESERLHPARAPLGDAPVQLFGDVWEWTTSDYAPYPGYRAPAGALGEYNGKFMINQRVLRGGSCATPRSHIRATYRNFFYPSARWQFSGIRLARDPL